MPEKPAPRRPRPATPKAALTVHHDPSAEVTALTARERDVLHEALRRGEDLRENVESAIASFGRWLLGEVFADDAAAALGDKGKNPVWRELLRRAGGPTLQVSSRMLYVAVHVAALDKRVTDQAWRGLDVGRKELLLPLGTDARLREGAQHVVKWNLSQSKTRAYVAEVLREVERPRPVRLTMPRLVARVQKVRTSLSGAAVLRRVGELRSMATAEERAAAAQELELLRATLGEIVKALHAKR